MNNSWLMPSTHRNYKRKPRIPGIDQCYELPVEPTETRWDQSWTYDFASLPHGLSLCRSYPMDSEIWSSERMPPDTAKVVGDGHSQRLGYSINLSTYKIGSVWELQYDTVDERSSICFCCSWCLLDAFYERLGLLNHTGHGRWLLTTNGRMAMTIQWLN